MVRPCRGEQQSGPDRWTPQWSAYPHTKYHWWSKPDTVEHCWHWQECGENIPNQRSERYDVRVLICHHRRSQHRTTIWNDKTLQTSQTCRQNVSNVWNSNYPFLLFCQWSGQFSTRRTIEKKVMIFVKVLKMNEKGIKSFQIKIRSWIQPGMNREDWCLYEWGREICWSRDLYLKNWTLNHQLNRTRKKKKYTEVDNWYNNCDDGDGVRSSDKCEYMACASVMGWWSW